jgi:uncharacterized protein
MVNTIKIEFLGKCLLIICEKSGKRVLVVGDLHLGFEEALRDSGVMLPVNIFEDVKRDFDEIFEFIEKKYGKMGVGVELSKGGKKSGDCGEKLVNKVILLGDIKHEFGKVMRDEWREVGEIMNYLRRKSDYVVVVKGNHDVIAGSVVGRLERVEFVDYYFLECEGVMFLHGDRDFPEIHGRDVRAWIVGHGHPAIVLHDKKGGVKKEKFKCFLDGLYKRRRIIVVPSFFSVNEGTDVLGNYDLGLAWDFDLKKFDIGVVGDGLKVLRFGKLGKI